jgi:putative acetyltransferase
MLIRRETGDAGAAIDDVHASAFGGRDAVEVALARAVRASPSWIPALSLGAVDGGVVGHVVCTRGYAGETAAVGLGPIGVVADRQGVGVGTALMHAVIAAADALDEPFVAVLGEPAYYGRFGFVPASTLGITAPDPEWVNYFQVRTLTTYRPGTTGTFGYAEPFNAL